MFIKYRWDRINIYILYTYTTFDSFSNGPLIFAADAFSKGLAAFGAFRVDEIQSANLQVLQLHSTLKSLLMRQPLSHQRSFFPIISKIEKEYSLNTTPSFGRSQALRSSDHDLTLASNKIIQNPLNHCRYYY